LSGPCILFYSITKRCTSDRDRGKIVIVGDEKYTFGKFMDLLRITSKINYQPAYPWNVLIFSIILESIDVFLNIRSL